MPVPLVNGLSYRTVPSSDCRYMFSNPLCTRDDGSTMSETCTIATDYSDFTFDLTNVMSADFDKDYNISIDFNGNTVSTLTPFNVKID